MIDIQKLIVSEEDLQRIAGIQQEELSYEVWSNMFSQITESIAGHIPHGTSRIDKISYLARQAYLAGFMQGVILINDVIKSYAVEEQEGA